MVGEAFDGNQLFAVQHRQEDQAGVDSRVSDRIIVGQFADHNGTSATVTFRAAFLGAFRIRSGTEPLQDGGSGRQVFPVQIDLDRVVLKKEANDVPQC